MQADVNSSDQYDFPELPSQNAFRVLYLEKSPGDGPLRYTLHDRDYEQMKNHFVAVSYVCGDTTDLIPSICNGKLHHIYHNLDSALRRVRKHYTDYPQPYAIWADGICINQRNVAEKMDQIAKMWRVFRNCAQVVVCLGPSCDNADLALGLFCKSAQEFEDLHTRSKGPPSQPHGQDLQMTVGENEIRAAFQFFSCAWFSRTWVVQEVNLWTDVRTSPIVLWGDYCINWGLLVRAHYMMTTRQLYAENQKIKAGTLIRTSAPVQGAEKPQAGPRSEGKRELLVSHYEPYEKLYERIARIIIDEASSILLLTHAGISRPRSTALPSWVPDWSHFPIWEPLEPKTEAAAQPTSAKLEELNEDGLLQVDCFFLDSVCMYAACCIGEFGEGQQRQDSGVDTIQDRSEYITAVLQCFGHCFRGYPTGEHPLEVFARTLVGNSPDVDRIDTSTDGLRFSLAAATMTCRDREARCLCPKEYRPNRGPGFDDETASHHFDENIPSSTHGAGPLDLHPKILALPAWYRPPRSEKGPEDFAENVESNRRYMDKAFDGDLYREIVQRHGQCRRFFASGRRYMGMGPAGLRRGDLVVLLKGCNLPFVLRVDKGAARNKCICHPRVFKLIGEAYVHGLSANEPLNNWQDFTNGESSTSRLPECAEAKSTESESDGPWVKVYLS
ncbi:heterokaryon incompatibility protein-domain-containing protein [Exophiala viscosa]|uniref:Heterokaryon incompatibility protein-domain-containing protein n=1 Tax=Exophiala viscosa TaxID=2486360 RepID=A0AAN6IIS8_9EURO|nr:heterokaryon incompatibility protein-domain-containing protein [Exophiala viscosa]KAI1628127.1 heterokaryon incompatibility protein-domain-containing protein [Exophiala viscosa]